MIIGSRFDGDTDSSLIVSQTQAELYDYALHTIIKGCQEHVRTAVLLLGQEWPEKWIPDTYFNHQTLCGAHDLIAAACRYRSFKTPLLDAQRAQNAISAKWISWLHNEVASWGNQPKIVQNVLTVLAKQDHPAGFRARSDLAETLLNRYSDVPWNASEWDRIYQLRQIAAKLEKHQPQAQSTQANASEVCECVTKKRRPCGQIPCKTLCERADLEGWGPLE